MASEQEIASAAGEWMIREGFVKDEVVAVSEVAKVIQGRLTGETQQSLEKKLRKLAANPDSGFTSHADGIAASEFAGDYETSTDRQRALP